MLSLHLITQKKWYYTEPSTTESCDYPQTYVDEYGCIDICRTIRGLTCEDGDICVDDPRDNCDPDDPYAPGSDCAGYCIPEEETSTTEEPCYGKGCQGSDASSYGLMVIFGIILSVFGWM